MSPRKAVPCWWPGEDGMGAPQSSHRRLEEPRPAQPAVGPTFQDFSLRGAVLAVSSRALVPPR